MVIELAEHVQGFRFNPQCYRKKRKTERTDKMILAGKGCTAKPDNLSSVP